MKLSRRQLLPLTAGAAALPAVLWTVGTQALIDGQSISSVRGRFISFGRMVEALPPVAKIEGDHRPALTPERNMWKFREPYLPSGR
jgi:hypothetical protein